MNQNNKNKAGKNSGYKIKDTYPGRTFSADEQRRIAAQISNTLACTQEKKGQKLGD